MEEIWNNISLPSLCTRPTTTATAGAAANFASLQDFLAKPFNRKNPSSKASAVPSTITKNATSSSSSLATELSLSSSGLDFNYLDNTGQDGLNISLFSGSNTLPFSTQSDTLTSSGFPSIQPSSKKREPEKDGNQDHRYKRMMKNREAATRSRARRQAYANELEHEVAKLREENAKLKKQEKMRMAAPALVPKTKTLHRTLTAPF